MLGINLHLGIFRIPSRFNAADDPARFVPLRSPSKPLPLWFKPLVQGDFDLFDMIMLADKLPSPYNRWARLALLSQLPDLMFAVVTSFDAASS